jgi:CDP-4-dehydro-6-deoxyglucose reductase
LPEITCPIRSVKNLNHDTRQILLDTVSGLDFKAGQYLEVISGTRRFPFSIASAPTQSPILELHVRPTPDSADSDEFKALLDEAKELTIAAPKGDCIVEEAPDKPLVMLAASTGVTQMKSIIEHLLEKGLPHPTYLYWGVVSDQDLYMGDLCHEWHERDPNFHYIPVVSDPNSSPNWTGRTGLVGEAALEDFEDLNLNVIVGGSPGMVYGTLDMFLARGFEEANMQSDVFSYAPR